MKWCLTCNYEYEDYAQKCSDCGATLVSEEHYHQTLNQKKMDAFPEAPKLVAVYEATLESDVLHVTELLKDYGIQSEIKNEGIGSYLQIYGGVNYLGTTICVDEANAEMAQSIIQNFWRQSDSEADSETDSETDLEVDDDASDMDALRESYNQSMRVKKNLLKVLIFLIFGTGIVYQILSIINQL